MLFILKIVWGSKGPGGLMNSSEDQKTLFILLSLKDDSAHSLEQSQLNECVDKVIEFNNKNYEDLNQLYKDFISIYEGLHRLRGTMTFGSIRGKQPLPEKMIKEINELIDQLEKINNEKIQKISRNR